MAVSSIHFRGFELRALAFHVPGADRYAASLLIVKSGALAESDCRLLTLKSGHEDGLFRTAIQAVNAALALGNKFVEARAGLTVEDLRQMCCQKRASH